DPTRLTTLAISGGWETGSGKSVDVMGFNYFTHGNTDHYHAKFPDQPTIGTEEASTFSTRGVYFDDEPNSHLSAYDVHGPSYGATAERWVNYYSTRPFVAGAFVWTGFDYRGETTPFTWPAISSQFGILDTCGFPKDNFYYYKSVWTDAPMVHLLPHWNWQGKEGQEIEVWCFSNCDEIELLLNNKSIARQAMAKLSHLQWKVKYEPGVLLARGYKQGKPVAEDQVETSAAAAAIVLQADRSTIHADGEDVAVVSVRVADSRGKTVPDASSEIQFAIDGPGKIIGVGNGDPLSHEQDQFVESDQSFAIAHWRMMQVESTDSRPEIAEGFDDSKWQSAFRQRDGNDRAIIPTKNAVYRGSVEMPQINSGWSMSLLLRRFGSEQWVYLNGKQIAHMDAQAKLSVDLKAGEFHAGRNVIAVVATPLPGRAGRQEGSPDVSLSTSVRAVTPAGEWKRSLFNGLAQVIVQSTQQSGEIKLTATSNGLTAGILKIDAQSQPQQ
ncbi:MAG TPA: DUF4982 domain-containing protein, partial [Tepidisphaeraceae bacterium]|nr:DUF4982 domain-containing protein [Tepidisphaeraceae bacterium]